MIKNLSIEEYFEGLMLSISVLLHTTALEPKLCEIIIILILFRKISISFLLSFLGFSSWNTLNIKNPIFTVFQSVKLNFWPNFTIVLEEQNWFGQWLYNSIFFNSIFQALFAYFLELSTSEVYLIGILWFFLWKVF